MGRISNLENREARRDSNMEARETDQRDFGRLCVEEERYPIPLLTHKQYMLVEETSEIYNCIVLP